MRTSDLKKELALHDAGVDSIEASPAEGVVRLQLDLPNYEQRWYREGDPEIVPGTLAFTGVIRMEAKPDLGTLDWGEGRLDGEIVEVKPLSSEEPHGDGVEFIIQTMDYRTRARDVLILRILGGEATWMPA